MSNNISTGQKQVKLSEIYEEWHLRQENKAYKSKGQRMGQWVCNYYNIADSDLFVCSDAIFWELFKIRATEYQW